MAQQVLLTLPNGHQYGIEKVWFCCWRSQSIWRFSPGGIALDTLRQGATAEGMAVQSRASQNGEKAMKKAMAILLTVPAVAAAEMPVIVGTIPNKDNSKITFTTYQGECKKGDRTVYTQNKGGRVTLVGCYRFIGEEMMVFWSDGDVYTYPAAALTLTAEMEAYVQIQ
jgi:hypothetical protein